MPFNIPNGKIRKFTAGEIEISPDNSKTTHGLKVDAKGNVGIGTNKPTQKLDIAGDVKIDGKLDGITMALNSTLASMTAQEVLRIGGTGDNFNTLVVMGKDETTEYVSLGINSSGWPTIAGGYVGTSGASRLAFATQAGGGASESIKMVLSSDGRLLVGTTSPISAEKLHVRKTTRGANTGILLTKGVSTGDEYLSLDIMDVDLASITAGAYGTGDCGLAFRTSDSTEAERIRITAEGDFLVGNYSGNARTWNDVSFASHWGNWDSNYYSVSYRKDGMGNVLLRGLIKCTNNSAAAGTSNPIFTLPSGYRPARRCIFHLAASFGGTRKTIEARAYPDGTFFLTTDDPAANDWFSVDGIMFSIDPD